MAHKVCLVLDEVQDDWDEHFNHAGPACNSSVSSATSLVLIGEHVGRSLRPLHTALDRRGSCIHQGLERDELE